MPAIDTACLACVRWDWESSLLFVCVPAVGNTYHKHKQFTIPDRVYDSPVTNTDTVKVFPSLKFLDAVGPGIGCQGIDTRGNAFLYRLGKI